MDGSQRDHIATTDSDIIMEVLKRTLLSLNLSLYSTIVDDLGN